MKYIQVPVGWWQDSKGIMQPPGSYLDVSLRIPSKRFARRAEQSSMNRSRRFFRGVRNDNS